MLEANWKAAINQLIYGYNMLPKAKPFKIVRAKDSKLMKVLGKLLSPLIHNFEKFTKTIMNTIYFPDALLLRNSNELAPTYEAFATLAHEMQHLLDRNWLMPVYTLPHLLAIPALLCFCLFGGASAGAITLAILLSSLLSIFSRRIPVLIATAVLILMSLGLAVAVTGWQSAWLFVAVLFASPALNWLGAAYGRAKAEARGYAANIFIAGITGHSVQPILDFSVNALTSASYYFPVPSKRSATKLLMKEQYNVGLGGLSAAIRNALIRSDLIMKYTDSQ